MTIQEVATKLLQLCEQGQFDEAYKSLFSEDAKSIEPDGTIAEGLVAILQKSDAFKAEVEFVSCEMGIPQFAGDYFSIAEAFYSRIKKTGVKKQMSEIAVYKVVDGKIVEERFFY